MYVTTLSDKQVQARSDVSFLNPKFVGTRQAEIMAFIKRENMYNPTEYYDHFGAQYLPLEYGSKKLIIDTAMRQSFKILLFGI